MRELPQIARGCASVFALLARDDVNDKVKFPTSDKVKFPTFSVAGF